jgi:methanogenic corrinoid protein MtbC1
MASRHLGALTGLITMVHRIFGDIGAYLGATVFDVTGFEVKDIGIDVPVKTFIDEINQFKPDVVGLSGFLTLAVESMKETIEAVQDAGLRDKLKIMIGGG